MPINPGKLSRFWHELKRRRIIHLITVYASASFVLIELVINLTEPLNLPSILSTIVIIVLAALCPIAIVLSWFYDLTGKGIEKTRPIEEIPQVKATRTPNTWKIATYVSFAVIIGLVTFNIVGSTKTLRAGDIQSIMILPIDNFTGDDGFDAFISGMHSVLIGDVGRVSNLKVMSRTTSAAYAGRSASQIAAEQGVDAIIQPTIMCLADSICFQLQIITPEGEQLWIADYREPKNQLSNLTNRITKELAEEVKVKLTENEKQMMAESRTADPDAYDAWVTGQNYWDQLNKEDLELARMYFERAIEIDPGWAPPYAGLSSAWGALSTFGDMPDSISMAKRYEYLNKALELDPNDAFVQYRVALNAVWTEWDWEKGEEAFVRSLEMNPNDARCRMYYAHLLTILRKSEAALKQAKLAKELDPLNPLIMGLYVVVLTRNGNCEEALDIYETAVSIDPDHSFLRGKLRKVYECMGDYDKVFALWRENAYPLWEQFGVSELLDRTYREEGYIAFVEEESRIMSEVIAKEIQISPWYFFRQSLTLEQYDIAMDYLEIIYEDHFQDSDIDIPYQSAKSVYGKLKVNPRYIAFLRRMNLPVE